MQFLHIFFFSFSFFSFPQFKKEDREGLRNGERENEIKKKKRERGEESVENKKEGLEFSA